MADKYGLLCRSYRVGCTTALYQCNRAAGFSFKQPFESLKRFASSKFIESLNLGFQGFVCIRAKDSSAVGG
jgi:hypothetical protein